MSYLSIRDLDLNGKRVFIRVDFNVPLQKNEQGEMEITSDKRIKASLPTIQYALEHGAGVILASHLGRPKGKPNAGDEPASRWPRASQELLGRPVKMAPDCVGPEVEAMKPAPGEVLLLENLRFHAEEEKNDPDVREAARRALRPLRQRRVRLRASRPRLHRRHDPLRPAGRRRPADGAGAEVSRHGDHESRRARASRSWAAPRSPTRSK